MRSFASDDGPGVLGWPGAQKKCFGLLSDCASATAVANANSKATTRCRLEIRLLEWVRICAFLFRKDHLLAASTPPQPHSPPELALCPRSAPEPRIGHRYWVVQARLGQRARP